jgi:hypothetical protein
MNNSNISDAATSGSDDEDNEFYDAQEEGGSMASAEDSSFTLKIPMSSSQQRRNSTDAATGSSSEGEENSHEKTQKVHVVTEGNQDLLNNTQMDQTDRVSVHSNNSLSPFQPPIRGVLKRRVRIMDKPNYPLNLWSIIKNCIGKDLSKIPMPVNFNEPLSMLQR